MLRTILRRSGSTPEQHALALAARHFPACAAHRREAAAVYLALGQIRPAPVNQADLDLTIGELLPHLTADRRPGHDSLAAIELQMALEEELGARDIVTLVAPALAAEKIMEQMLGSAAESSQWDASTIWMRSLRGVINERVRHSLGCACGEAMGV